MGLVIVALCWTVRVFCMDVDVCCIDEQFLCVGQYVSFLWLLMFVVLTNSSSVLDHMCLLYGY